MDKGGDNARSLEELAKSHDPRTFGTTAGVREREREEVLPRPQGGDEQKNKEPPQQNKKHLSEKHVCGTCGRRYTHHHIIQHCRTKKHQHALQGIQANPSQTINDSKISHILMTTQWINTLPTFLRAPRTQATRGSSSSSPATRRT